MCIIATSPFRSFQEETDEVVKLFLAERMPERTAEQIGGMPMPQIQEHFAEVAKFIPQANALLEHIVEQTRRMYQYLRTSGTNYAEVAKIIPARAHLLSVHC